MNGTSNNCMDFATVYLLFSQIASKILRRDLVIDSTCGFDRVRVSKTLLKTVHKHLSS